MTRSKGETGDAQEALDAFRAFVRRRSLRMTGVREAIVEAAVGCSGHFRVEDLADQVRAMGIEASTATVYRALPLLIEAGIVQPTEVWGSKGWYETSFGREGHQHLVCRGCSKVIEFQFEAFQILEREIARRHGFELTGHVHELIGFCAECHGAGHQRH